ncbi:MAG: M3 family oligoendopeptidase [Erysipelotrichaceae bacterium]|nr:M3 family oligoendopeptidase [Erysipelotrichaceae bacterium]
MKFIEMPYARLDDNSIIATGERIIFQFTNANTKEEAFDAFKDWQSLLAKISTQSTLAAVRQQIDTNDDFYDKEQAYWDNVMPKLEATMQKFTLALLSSKFKADFVNSFGDLLFKNAEMQLKTFKPEVITELQEENRLTTEYAKLIASAQIMFDDDLKTLSQLSPYKQSADDKIRREAWLAESKFYVDNKDNLDEIYDKLVKIRTKIANKLGYKNFVELGYYRMVRNSYDQKDVSKFREAVVKYIVPLADMLKKQQASRIGVAYPMSFVDDALTYRSGNAKPHGSADDILAHARKMYHELSDETKEFIDFMYDNQLLDVLSKKGKAGGGFCTEFADYKAPFIFANFNGTQHDVEVMTHEAGHAFAAYMAKDVFPLEYRNPTLESCEIHSMTMEFFAWPWAEGFFKDDTDKFYYGHLEGALTFIPYGTMVDHFQHIVYENPGLTKEERHEKWRELEAIYRPWLKIADLPFYGEGKGWQRQQHIYSSPFYYIDYCLAQAVALQFWAKMQSDRKQTWLDYLALVRKAGTLTFSELVDTAGLTTPFGEEGLSDVAKVANDFLNTFDKNKLK